MKKQTVCILTPDDVYHLPRPTSVSAGQARSVWLKNLTGKQSYICSPDAWDVLAKHYPVLMLTEHDDGSWTTTPVEQA